MSELIVITYDTSSKAMGALDELASLQKLQLIELEDAAVVSMNQKGKVKVKQTLEKKVTGTATVWGFFWGLLIGLIFINPLLWGLFGAVLGYISGRSTDVGIDNKFVKEVGESLEPGQAALFMLVIKATEDKVIPELAKTGGHLYQTSLSNEDEAKLKAALEHDDVQKAAADAMELDATTES
jgi:uncharacterized membrane protein